jgi:pyridoxine/pyridoxamine 5'-phosphate oxidase
MNTRENQVPAAGLDLKKILEQSWRSLMQGALQSDSAYRTAVVGAVSAHGAELRTVVLRQADEARRSLVFYTDGRSGKAGEFRQTGQAAWLFFDPVEGIQIRARSRVSLHQEDEIARECWSQVPQASRTVYAFSQAPGQALDSTKAAYLEDEKAFLNFLVVRCELTFLDWLQIHDSGHLRAQFSWDGRTWNGVRVAP